MLPPLHAVGQPRPIQPLSGFSQKLNEGSADDRILLYFEMPANEHEGSFCLSLRRKLEAFPVSTLFTLWPGRSAAILPSAFCVHGLLTALAEEKCVAWTRCCMLPLPANDTTDACTLLSCCEQGLHQMRRHGTTFAELPHHDLASATVCETTRTMVDELHTVALALERTQVEAGADVLTGLPNPRTMQRYLQAAIREGEPFAVLLVDGDNLPVLKQQSYAQGDALLRHLASLLYAQLGNYDEIARWRLGDEFLVLLHTASQTRAKEVAERMVKAVRTHPWPMPLTISVGIAMYPTHATTVETLIAAAESAMKEAKLLGKDRALFPPDEALMMTG